MTRSTLRWEPSSPTSWHAYSNEIIVGFVVQVTGGEKKGRFIWEMNAVYTRRIVVGRGDVATAARGKASVARAWRTWLELAGLEPVPVSLLSAETTLRVLRGGS